MYLDFKDDFHFNTHQIEFIITFDKRTNNKIKLLNCELDDIFHNPIIYGITPTKVKDDFSDIVPLFRNSDTTYTLPYGIMLKIIGKYDNDMYHKYKDYYVPDHDVIVIDAHIKYHEEVSQRLKTLKRSY